MAGVTIKALGSGQICGTTRCVEGYWLNDVKRFIHQEIELPPANQILINGSEGYPFPPVGHIYRAGETVARHYQRSTQCIYVLAYTEEVDDHIDAICRKYGFKQIGPLKIRSLTMEEKLTNFQELPSIFDVKKEIRQKHNIPCSRQTLMFQNEVLSGDISLSYILSQINKSHIF